MKNDSFAVEDVELYLSSLRISQIDSTKYARALFELGVDDLNSLKEDTDASLLERSGMKPVHITKVAKALWGTIGDSKSQYIPDLHGQRISNPADSLGVVNAIEISMRSKLESKGQIKSGCLAGDEELTSGNEWDN